MSFFISDAIAAPAASEPSMLVTFGPLLLLFVVFYFLLIRPQNKRQKEHKNMLEALGKGDEVVTSGGLLGKVTAVGESFLTVDLGQNQIVKVQKGSVSNVMPKGTIKTATKENQS